MTMWIPREANGMITGRWGRGEAKKKDGVEVDSDPQDMDVGVAECGVVSAKEWEEFQEVRRTRCRKNGCNKKPGFCAGFARQGCTHE